MFGARPQPARWVLSARRAVKKTAKDRCEGPSAGECWNVAGIDEARQALLDGGGCGLISLRETERDPEHDEFEELAGATCRRSQATDELAQKDPTDAGLVGEVRWESGTNRSAHTRVTVDPEQDRSEPD